MDLEHSVAVYIQYSNTVFQVHIPNFNVANLMDYTCTCSSRCNVLALDLTDFASQENETGVLRDTIANWFI